VAGGKGPRWRAGERSPPRIGQVENWRVEQVWFPGSHGDIGGGYTVETRGNRKYMDDITLDWMIRRVLTVDREFPVAPDLIPSEHKTSYVTALHHESRRGMYRLLLQ
jgi:hypothetical protein